jgi:DNA-directed RNA polymerase specialized sigma24 family protein
MAATILPASRDPRAADLLRAAFRDVHGPRLHGFALLLALGDRTAAGGAASRALAAGTMRADELRHPERAAAWLRMRVTRELRRSATRPMTVAARAAVLGDLGMGVAAIEGLAGLPFDERAAMIAGGIERFDLTDVATILDHNLAATRRILRDAREHYLAAATDALGDRPITELPSGDLARRVDEATDWAFGRQRPAATS